MTAALGLNFHHDTAACVVVDGRIIAAEEERWSGIKHNRVRREDHLSAPVESLRYCLDRAGLDVRDIGAVWGASMAPNPAAGAWSSTERDRLAAWMPPPLGRRLQLLSHHTAHLLSGALLGALSPNERAAGLVVDAGGSALNADMSGRERISGFHFVDATWERVHQQLPTYHPSPTGPQRREHSLGHLYRNLAVRVVPPGDEPEGSMMALAALGEPGRFRTAVAELVSHDQGGRVHVRPPWGSYRPQGPIHLAGHVWDRSAPRPEQDRRDLAAAAQMMFEGAVVHIARHLNTITGADTLVFAGGCALNTRLNAVLADRAGFAQLFVPPAPHDAGTALGAALYGWCVALGQPQPSGIMDADWGPPPDDLDPPTIARLRAAGAAVNEGLDANDLTDRVVSLLTAECVVGWVQGNMEFGPRALGHRSILAHPGSVAIRDRINRIKQRAAYRPLAPAVLARHADTYFDGAIDPFMNRTAVVRAEHRANLSGVVHTDGTARVQAVADNHRGLAGLLRHFASRTGLPILINTSLNLKGNPIVRTAAEAASAFEVLGLDALAVGNTLVTRGRCAEGHS